MGGGGGRRGGGGRTTRGSDLRYNLSVSLEDAYSGQTGHPSRLPSPAPPARSATGIGDPKAGSEPDTCPTCSAASARSARNRAFSRSNAPAPPVQWHAARSSRTPVRLLRRGGPGPARADALRVNIPAGVETGTRIRLSGEGEAGMRGGPSGDLYIFIEGEDHRASSSATAAISTAVMPVSMVSRRAWAATLEAPTIDGGRTLVRVPGRGAIRQADAPEAARACPPCAALAHRRPLP